MLNNNLPLGEKGLNMVTSKSVETITTLLNEKQAAQILSLTPRALQAWRVQGRGPKHVRISGACVRYRPEDIQAFIEANLKQSTSEA
jgi:predicted DNA-binding transcriptional regulator AlpA